MRAESTVDNLATICFPSMLTLPKAIPPGSLHSTSVPPAEAAYPHWGQSWPALEWKSASLELLLRVQLSSLRPHRTRLIPWPRDCPLLFGDSDRVPSPNSFSRRN